MARFFRSCTVHFSHACSPHRYLQQCFGFLVSRWTCLLCLVLFWDHQKSGSFYSKVTTAYYSGFHFSSPCFVCQTSILNQTRLNSCLVLKESPKDGYNRGLIAPESKVLCFLASTCEELVNLHLVSEGKGKQLC